MFYSPTPMTPSETLTVLTAIASFHPPQDLGDATVAAWCGAFREQNVHHVTDALTAVRRYYSDPANSDPWIKPWHVVAGYREIRSERMKGIGPESVDGDLDPEDPNWFPIVNARLKAVRDGHPLLPEWQDSSRRPISPELAAQIAELESGEAE